ncbi:MAG TPA: SHOCT domain-containing protein [Desulfotignum sp.]|nr:SHOCT domain-containing protein [Desulfotignum sp.]
MKHMVLASLMVSVMILYSSGCTHRMDGGRGWGPMMGYGIYGGIFMWILLVAVAVALIYYIFARNKNNPDFSKEDSMEILKKRYARGEISKEEFDRIKKEIEK